MLHNNKDNAVMAFCECHDPSHQVQVRPWHGYADGERDVKPEDMDLAFTILSRPVTMWDRVKDAWKGLTGDGFESMDVIVPTEAFLRMAEEIRKMGEARGTPAGGEAVAGDLDRRA